MRRARKKMEMIKRGPKIGLRKERWRKEPYYLSPARIMLLFFILI